ncbi:MAG: hypothetical protein EXR00_06925, partial [Alphaproteobacteria bacterium]|nr:hypothetical protein [Alphaproteobacteria bacterium]
MATRPPVEMLWSLPAFRVLLIALFLSFSRGAWINFLIGAGIFLVLSYATAEPRQRARLVGFTLMLTVIAAIAIAIAIALSFEEIRSLFVQRF